MLGKEVMENVVFTEIGVEKPDELMEHLNVKEEIAQDFVFSKETHDNIWNQMRKGNNYVSITELLPYYMLFFFTYLFAQLEKRKMGFYDLLNPQMKASLYNCFVRAGLDP